MKLHSLFLATAIALGSLTLPDLLPTAWAQTAPAAANGQSTAPHAAVVAQF